MLSEAKHLLLVPRAREAGFSIRDKRRESRARPKTDRVMLSEAKHLLLIPLRERWIFQSATTGASRGEPLDNFLDNVPGDTP